MNKSTFWSLFLLLNLLFVFAKIYQHNVFVKEVFLKQKLLSQNNSIQLEINKLEKELLSLKNNQSLLAEAQELGMQPIKISQISSFEPSSFEQGA